MPSSPEPEATTPPATADTRSLWGTTARVVLYSLFLVYLVPAGVMFMSRQAFMFANAWDEETYLSFQGAHASARVAGYYLSWVTVALHNVGLSGAVQNVLWDVLAPFGIFAVVAALSRRLHATRRTAWFLGSVVAFGALLFNSINPLVPALAAWLPGVTVPSDPGLAVLRSPNPQLSMLVIALAAYAYARLRRILVLVLPIPILYWAVIPAYLYVVACVVATHVTRPRSVGRVVAINALMVPLVGGLMYLAVQAVQTVTPGFRESRFATAGTDVGFVLTIAAVLSAAFYLIALPGIGRHPHGRVLHRISLALLGSLVAVPNLHFFTRIPLNPAGLYAASGPPLVAIQFAILCLVYLHLWERGKRVSRLGAFAFRGAVVACLLYFLVIGAGFDPVNRQFRVFVNEDLPADVVQRVQRDPLHALLPNHGLSAKLVLSAPRMMLPAFATQYTFPGVYNDCALNATLHRDAADAYRKLDLTPDMRREFDLHQAFIADAVRGFSDTTFREGRSYCTESTYAPGEFYVVAPTGSRGIWAVFPDWQQGQ